MNICNGYVPSAVTRLLLRIGPAKFICLDPVLLASSSVRDNPVYCESAAATEPLGTRWVTCAITGVCDQINFVKL